MRPSLYRYQPKPPWTCYAGLPTRLLVDELKMSFAVAEQRAFWRPVREAFRDFLRNLSNGVSQAITAVAYIVPWLFVVVPGLYLVRFLWRRRGR